MKARAQHSRTEMTFLEGFYKSSSVRRGGGHIGHYVCARCGRETKQLQNFLGRKVPVCYGTKIEKELPEKGKEVKPNGEVQHEGTSGA